MLRGFPKYIRRIPRRPSLTGLESDGARDKGTQGPQLKKTLQGSAYPLFKIGIFCSFLLLVFVLKTIYFFFLNACTILIYLRLT